MMTYCTVLLYNTIYSKLDSVYSNPIYILSTIVITSSDITLLKLFCLHLIKYKTVFHVPNNQSQHSVYEALFNEYFLNELWTNNTYVVYFLFYFLK